MNRMWWIGAVLVGLPGCARGCSTPPPKHVPPVPPHSRTTPPTSARPPVAEAIKRAPRALVATVETALTIRLPERLKDAPFPGFDTLPRRRLRRFVAANHLVVTLRKAQMTILGQEVAASDTDAVRTSLRRAIESWSARSGVAANRLILAVDKDASPQAASSLRRVAMQAHSWRVVALAREGERLMEVHLSPPGQRRP